MNSSQLGGYHVRGLEPAVRRAWNVAPIVILEGPRASGKTTMCESLALNLGIETKVDLSDPSTRAEVMLDPHGFVRSLRRPALIDEAQLVDELAVAIKHVVDAAGGQPGQFLLTGSSSVGRGTLGGSDPLVGRAARLTLRPFTAAERLGIEAADRLTALFAEDPQRSTIEAIDKRNTLDLALTGGLPSAPGVIRPGDERDRLLFFDQYVEGALNLSPLVARTDRAALVRCARYLLSNPAQVLVHARVANDLGLRAETVAKYVDILQAAGLVWRLPADRPTEHASVAAHPKLHAADTALIDWASRGLAFGAAGTAVDRAQASITGALVENLVLNEIAAQCDWSYGDFTVRYWRNTKTKREVDAVVLHRNGQVIAFEVKAAGLATVDDTAGLQALKHSLGDRLVRSFVVYTGDRVAPLAQDVWALPISSLVGVGPVDP